MRIEDVKAWHWVVAGLLAGLLYSGVLTHAGPWFDTESMDTVDASTFEHALLGRLLRKGDLRLLDHYHKGQPVVRNVIVHPPIPGEHSGKYWVTGELYAIYPQPKDMHNVRGPMVVYEQWTPFKYPAPAPYPGQNGPVGVAGKTYPTVAGYLAALAPTKGAEFTYRFAWPETNWARWSLPPLAGLLLIGIAWPMAIGAMRRVGLAQAPAVKKVAVPSLAPAEAPPKPTVAQAVVRVPPPPTPPPAAVGDGKRYGGEFYPVEKKPTH